MVIGSPSFRCSDASKPMGAHVANGHRDRRARFQHIYSLQWN